MKIYKFRSLHQFEYLYDIIENKMVYCAKYQDLNDPFEGQFIKMYKTMFGSNQFGSAQFGTTSTRKSIETIYKLENLRICSFSKSYKDVRMWSYYANAHKGICIEFEIPDNLINDVFYNVEYEKTLKPVSSETMTKEIAINILKRKTDHWAYEDEIRLITENEKYPLIPQQIILGHRANTNSVGIIRKIAQNIPVVQGFLTDNLTVEKSNHSTTV